MDNMRYHPSCPYNELTQRRTVIAEAESCYEHGVAADGEITPGTALPSALSLYIYIPSLLRGGWKRLEQLRIAHLFGIEHHAHHFVVASHAAAHFLVGRVGRVATGVADRRQVRPPVVVRNTSPVPKQPSPNSAISMPSGYGGSSGWALRKCFARHAHLYPRAPAAPRRAPAFSAFFVKSSMPSHLFCLV